MTIAQRVEALSLNFRCPYCGAGKHEACKTGADVPAGRPHRERRALGRRVL